MSKDKNSNHDDYPEYEDGELKDRLHALDEYCDEHHPGFIYKLECLMDNVVDHIGEIQGEFYMAACHRVLKIAKDHIDCIERHDEEIANFRKNEK